MKKLSIFAKFAIIACGITLTVTLMMHSFFYKQENGLLDLRLREKVNFISRVYTILTAQAIQSDDDVSLLQIVESLEADPEVTSVIVVDQKGEIRYHIDPQRVGTMLDDKQISTVLNTGDGGMNVSSNAGGKSLILIAPLKIQGQPQPIGAMRIEITYHLVESQIASSGTALFTIFLGLAVFSVVVIISAVRHYFYVPLSILNRNILSVNTSAPEANLPESSELFGIINTSLNDLILRFKAEWQNRYAQTVEHGDQEKSMVRLFAESFLPGARMLAADKDNALIYDSANSDLPHGGHMMDLITDANFANLVNAALQKEGEVMRGPVSFQDASYEAAVLCVPGQNSAVVKTLIALTPPLDQTPDASEVDSGGMKPETT
jgi:hypothetical protein